MKKYLNDKGFGVLKALDAAAKKHNANDTQVALAWLMQRKSITAPIVSATSLDQLKDLIASPAIKLDRGVGRRPRQGERAGLMCWRRATSVVRLWLQHKR